MQVKRIMFVLSLILIAAVALWALDTPQTTHTVTIGPSNVTGGDAADTPFEITDQPLARCWYLDENRLLCITETFDPKNETVHVSQQMYTRGGK